MKKLSFLFAALVAGAFGLSAQAVEKELIPYSSAMTATASTQYSDTRGVLKAINGAGLNADGQHTTNADDSWLAKNSGFPSGGIWYRVDLGASYNLCSIKVWNYNYKADRGAKETDIYYSTAENPEGSTSPSSDWTLLRTVELEKATGAATYTGMDPIDFGPVIARYVLFHIKSVWKDYGGLSEVQFFQMHLFGDCSLTKINDGEFKLVGSVEGVDASDVKLVFSADGQEDVEIDLGPQTAGVRFERTVTRSDGLLTTCLYRAKLVSTTSAGVNKFDFPGTFFFGMTPKVFDFKKKIDFVLSAEAQAALGAGVVDGVPVAIRVSTDIQGFDYADMNASGTDVIFGAVDGSEITRYPYELEKWDPNGESVFWVKVPSLSAATTISMCYGNDVSVPDNIPTDVWSNYVGVWHMNEASGEVADATGHGLTATPKNGSNNATQLAQMVATEGVVGNARINSTADQSKGNYLSIPSYDSFGLGGQFTMSAFIFVSKLNGYPRIFSRKTAHGDSNGWEIENANSSSTKYSARGADGGSFTVTVPSDHVGRWMHLALAYDNKTLTSYVDGAKSTSGSIAAATDNAKPLSIGNNSNGSERSLLGSYDEVRMYNGVQSADRVKAEYLAMLGTTLVASEATVIDETAVRFAGKPALSKAGDTFKVSVTAASNSGTGVLTAVYGAADEGEKSIAVSDVVEPDATYTATLTGMTADKSYRAGFFAVNDKETETRAYATNVLYNGTLTITKGADADEKDLATPGTIIVSRGDAYGPLTVNYTVGGTAVGGTHYRELPGTIVIPDGATSATIEIWPIRTKTDDHTATITLAEGLYFIDDGAKSATITVKKLVAPDGWNTWLANGSGLASVAENWSDGVPKAGDKILFDGRYSTADCEWDGGVNGLTDSVAEWKQTEDYSGTVTFLTTFPNYANSTFKTFTVIGAMTIDGGMVTHPQTIDLPNDSKAYTIAELRAKYTYRLCLSVGSLAIGEGGKIDVRGKGHRQSPTTSGGRCPGYVTAHGGRYDNSSFPCYGNVKYPEDIGTAAGAGTDGSGSKHAAGGGAVKITSSGACVVNGEISADGLASSGKLTAAAAGSILIEAPSVTGSGSIHADGPYSGNNSYRNGVGGRVALLTTMPVDTDALTVSAGSSGSGKYGAEGTVYLMDSTMTDGVLYLNNPLYSSSNSTPGMGAYVTNEEGIEWKFDGIKLNGHVNLYVPVGTTLTLPNGFASVSAPKNASRVSGIYYRGGTIDVGSDDQTIGNGYWYFFPSSNFVFSANLTVSGNAAIGGCTYWEQSAIANRSAPTASWKTLFEVVGDMTIASDGVVTADSLGLGQQSGEQYEGVAIGNHGGRRSATGTTMDSVFEPHVCGVYQSNSYGYVKAGGVIDFTVGGCLTVDGNIHSDSPDSGDSQRGNAAGGAINIQAGSIAGSGTISASATKDTQCGGRVAVKLTNIGETFDEFTGAIYANGGGNGSKSSAGSVYLQDGVSSDKCGVITIDNRNKEGLYTPICATGYEADSVEDFKKANLVLSNKGRAQVSVADADGNFKMSSLSVDSTSQLDLFGKTLTVNTATLGGTKLKPGTYAAGDAALGDFVIDSVDGGLLVVKGSGMVILVK